ncbi:MAG TPA: molybdopterin-dependent oxidoreductase [Vicinamibacterales bacterium]|nr:molybdopterin-dependent oxidoreductase [Vicinamibacterales bacterium]
METVRLTIDGRQVTVEKGRTVLQAAIDHGIKIPYYCYHPGLGVDGSCRVCIVKIEKMPKLQTACSTVCADGMVVYTDTPEVVDARASVFEFLLINHPLDCPVCDKGGECPLQDFSYTFGPNRSRMEFPRRVFDGEGLRADVEFGPTLMLNRNRCILCTRCVRFMREIDGDAQIGIVDRGYGSEIATFQEQGVHSLISGNLMDVCPVGALTTRDYRFKSRPWDNPHAVDTICTLCEKGCNTTAWIRAKVEWAKGAKLIRITPRFNPDVNGYWMCDIGRFGFHWVEGDQRMRRPFVRGAAGSFEPQGWHDTLVKLRERVDAAGGTLGFLVSAHASLEEMFLVKQIAGALGAAPVAVTWTASEKSQSKNTRFPVPLVDAPNVSGARDLGLVAAGARQPDLSALKSGVERRTISAVYVLDPGPDGSLGDVKWLIDARRDGALPLLIVEGTLMTALAEAADFILPGAAYVEKDATYTNGGGRVQAASQVMLPPGDAMADWQILVNVAVSLGAAVTTYSSPAHVRADLAAALGGNAAYAAITTLEFTRPLPARTWLQASNPSERWKWDFMFQDLPPVKFKGEPEASSRPDIIPLKRVE